MYVFPVYTSVPRMTLHDSRIVSASSGSCRGFNINPLYIQVFWPCQGSQVLYIYIYIHVSLSLSLYIYTHTYMYICMYVCLYMHILILYVCAFLICIY